MCCRERGWFVLHAAICFACIASAKQVVILVVVIKVVALGKRRSHQTLSSELFVEFKQQNNSSIRDGCILKNKQNQINPSISCWSN